MTGIRLCNVSCLAYVDLRLQLRLSFVGRTLSTKEAFASLCGVDQI